jgi:hypothetical protein
LPPAGIGALLLAAGVLAAAMAWQAANAQMLAMMNLVWIFTGSPFVHMSIEGRTAARAGETGIVSIFPEYIIPRPQWRCFFGAAAIGPDGSSASARKPRRMTQPRLPAGSR